jgi:predicted RNA-binding protein with PIN domain
MRRAARTPQWPKDPKRYRWFVDGHNAIFAHPTLEALQTGEEQGQARRLLESMLDRLAAAHGLKVTVVYDGNESTQNPDAGTRGWIVSHYSLRPDEDADDRIVLLVNDSVGRGEKVVVVTNDHELCERLPSGVIRIEPEELFRRLQAPADSTDDKPPPGDYSDIEEHFLSLEPPKPRPPERRAPPPKSRTTGIRPVGSRPTGPRPAGQRPTGSRPRPSVSRGTPPPSPRARTDPAAPPDRDLDALARKKARGRRKQERRLAQPRRKRRRRRGR